MLESLRGHDVHALNRRAPRAICPNVTRLYELAAAAAPRVVASPKTYQAGTRTSQGLAASLCGLGTIPFGLSAARDLGLLPLRCLSDVLADATFSLGFYYGSNPGFDNMAAFLGYHGFRQLVTEHDYREEIPHRGWSVPDALVLAQALADSARRPADTSQYNLAMSLTNHFPFREPEDFPPALGRAVDEAVRASGRAVPPDDLARLKTLSYSDWALGRFLEALDASPQAVESLVVVAADHADNAHFAWRDEPSPNGRDLDVARALVPFAIVLPAPLVAGSPDPDAVRVAVRRLNDELATTPLSQNDIPLAVLWLLSHWHETGSLPASWRWHTIGGQVLSETFAVASRPDAIVVGIDASGQLFAVDARDRLVVRDEPVPYLLDLREAADAPSLLRPSAATLSAFARTYGRDCRGPEHVRRQP